MANKRTVNYHGFDPPLTKYQKDAFFNDYRYCWIIASTKSGKTHSALCWLCEQAVLFGGLNKHFWWVAPSTNQAKIAYDRLKYSLPTSAFTSNDTNRIITLFNGSVIEFKSGDNPDLLFGEDVYAAVIDEASRCREQSYYAVRSTLTKTQGKIRLIGNVRGRHNFFWINAQKAKDGLENHAYFTMNSHDAVEAGIISQEEFEDAKRSLPEDVFNELYLNIPADDGANPFGLSSIQNCIRELSQRKAVCYGIDLGKVIDYTVIIGLDDFGQVCEIHRFKEDWSFAMEKILAIVNKPTLIDSTGLGGPIFDILKSRKPGIFTNFSFSSTSKQQLMEGLALGIQSGQVRFPEGVIKDELDAYEYEYTRTGVFYSSRIHDDSVCALGLAWQQWQKSSKVFGLWSEALDM